MARRLHRWCVALPLLLSPAAAAAQLPGGGAGRIAHVEINRNSIFDPEESGHWLINLVNRLHITTRPYVVRQELLFRRGDPWDSARVAESERNLRRLGVFRTVTIDSVTTDSGLVARVTTRDGWSTRPDFRFRSTGGEVAYTVALIEDNLFGTASQASLIHRSNPDRSTTTLGFRQPRLINGRTGLEVRYEDRSDGFRTAGWFGTPFHAMESPASWRVEAERRDETVLVFRNGMREPFDSVDRDYAVVRGEVARALRASSSGYLRVGLGVQVRRDDLHPYLVTPPEERHRRGPVTGAVNLWAQRRWADYAKVRGYNALGREEDIDLSTVIHAGIWLAPAGLGYRSTGIGPDIQLRTGARLPGGFATATVRANALWSNGFTLDSGSVQASGTIALLPSRGHLAVLHGTAGMLKAPIPGAEYDLGLGSGPRGFAQHAFTGDRGFFLSGEYRYGVVEDFLKVVDVGVAAFADYGGAWWRGYERRTGWSAGVGLRLGTSRAPDLEANRLDLVWRSGTGGGKGEWVFVVAKGFAFASGLRGEQ